MPPDGERCKKNENEPHDEHIEEQFGELEPSWARNESRLAGCGKGFELVCGGALMRSAAKPMPNQLPPWR